MTNFLVQITNFLWTQSWQIAVLAIIIALISLAIKNKSAHIRYLLWLIILVKALVPPLLTIPLAIFPEEQNSEAFSIPPTQWPTTISDDLKAKQKPYILQPTPSAETQAQTAKGRLAKLTANLWLAVAWIIGAAVFSFAVLIKFVKINRSLKRQRRPIPPHRQKWMKDIFKNLGLKSYPKIWQIEGIGQPFIWGFTRGNVYLPSNFSQLVHPEHCRNVLVHELCHILRYDVAINLIQLITQTIYWFHPLIWWVNKQLRQEREKCCDEMAIARLNALPKDYSTAIVKTLIDNNELTRPSPSLAVTDSVKNIANRIKIIMKPGKKFYKHPSLTAVVMILSLAAFFIPITMALTEKTTDKLKVVDVKFEPFQRGKNFVSVKVENISSQDQNFGIFTHTNSPDLGRNVSWCGVFFDTIRPKDTKWSRFNFRIVGPITKNTRIHLIFYNPDSSGRTDLRKIFLQKKYTGKELERIKTVP